jgi:hypothetical protein
MGHQFGPEKAAWRPGSLALWGDFGLPSEGEDQSWSGREGQWPTLTESTGVLCLDGHPRAMASSSVEERGAERPSVEFCRGPGSCRHLGYGMRGAVEVSIGECHSDCG